MVGGGLIKNSMQTYNIDSVQVTYDTWLIGFDEKQNITDYEVFLNSASTKEDGIKFASSLDKAKLKLREDLPDNVSTLALVVETVGMDVDACVAVNVANVYEELIEVKNN